MTEHTGAKTREDILRAAIKALARSNYAEISMQDIASASGITKPTIYYYFASKKGLFVALASYITGKIRGVIEEETGSSRSLRDSLVRIAGRILDSPITSPDFARVHLAFSTDPSLKALVPTLKSDFEGIHSLLVEHLKRARSRGEVRDDADVELVGRIFVSVLHTYLAMRIEGGPGDAREPGARQIVEVLMRGVTCDPGGES
jgi:AcrR family transcriptional regulator